MSTTEITRPRVGSELQAQALRYIAKGGTSYCFNAQTVAALNRRGLITNDNGHGYGYGLTADGEVEALRLLREHQADIQAAGITIASVTRTIARLEAKVIA